jgi:hypothetical protein
VVEQARAQGLVSDRLHIIDATHMTAKMDLFRLKKEHRDGDDDDHYVDRTLQTRTPVSAARPRRRGFMATKATWCRTRTPS